jgi:hypothetical protein
VKGADERPIVLLRVCDIDDKFDGLARRVAELIAPVAPTLLTRGGLAQALSCSEKHIDRLRHEGMPELRVGDSPRFEIAEVLRWLRARSETPGLRIVGGRK